MKRTLKLFLVVAVQIIGVSWGYSQTTFSNINSNMKDTEKITRDVVTEYYKYVSEREVDKVVEMITKHCNCKVTQSKGLASLLKITSNI